MAMKWNSDSQKLQDWSLTIRWFSVIFKTLVKEEVLHLYIDAVGVIYSPTDQKETRSENTKKTKQQKKTNKTKQKTTTKTNKKQSNQKQNRFRLTLASHNSPARIVISFRLEDNSCMKKAEN